MILGHALSKASTVILLSLAVVLNAGLTECDDKNPPGCADYIRAGLGYDGPVQITQTKYEYYVTTQHVTVTAGSPPAPPPPNQDLAAASACSSSWSKYRSRASRNVVWKHITTTVYQALTTDLTYGTGDVYSTEPVYKIPVARGNFTATSTATSRVLNITSISETATESTRNKTLARATPTCDLLKPKECSKLYVEYISSLGLPYNASVPKVTPAPANSPPCPEYFYKPFSTCQKSFVTSYSNDCTIMGNSVQLFYFPTQSTTPTIEPSGTITQPPAVVYEYAPGTTFTSPSIYLKFDYLSAERGIYANDALYCTTCNEKGCVTQGVDGGQAIKYEGTSIKGQLVSLAPQEVSSIVLNFDEKEASSIISTMAHNLPGYADVMQKVAGNFNVTARPLNLSDVLHPPPEAYYLQPLENAPGCDPLAPQPQCSTIYEGAYRALISLPQEVTGFQGAWKSCFPVIYGVYDPPIALTKASVAEGPTLPGGYKPTPGPERPNQTPPTAEPGNLPQIPPFARPTALPNELPPEGSPAGPTLPPNYGGSSGGKGGGSGNNGGGGSNNGGSGNGGSGSNNGGSGNNGGGSNNGGSGNNVGDSNNGGSGSNGGSNNQGAQNNGGGSFNNGGSSGGNGGSSGEGGGSPNNNDQGSGSGRGGENGSGNNSSGGSGQGSEGSNNNSGGSSGGNGQGSTGENNNSSGGSSDNDNNNKNNNDDNEDSSSNSGNGDSGSESNGGNNSNDNNSSGDGGNPSLASSSMQSVGLHLLALYACTVVLLAEMLAP
ncbi:hypothetical protein CKM354_000197900 [Cercospora kikuchii]|uniref:Uncharacterized protein n=1 Tax=Cercospora kikuchii TaxID=84275 RepID=A0A9P3CH81_9PEZI|nr:uncharacterized protein CKM354_000197900 [Cercospora kikuchii]GIZ38563.1 hypothetical protein CKM354_000197900 [Cercospora kikuchii]